MTAQVQADTADEVRALIAHILAGVAGGTEASWRKLIGEVERLPTWRYVRFNWRVQPSGTIEQREWIGRAQEVVRAEHPYVR